MSVEYAYECLCVHVAAAGLFVLSIAYKLNCSLRVLLVVFSLSRLPFS